MKILIVEDDINITTVLEKIIKDRNLGSILDVIHDGKRARQAILEHKPEIVLIDFLMPEDDGISIVEGTKTKCPNTNFIMISQVTSKDLVGKAFESGIEYYVYKPVNAIEVVTVINKVKEKIELEQKMKLIQGLFGEISIPKQSNIVAAPKEYKSTLKYLNSIFQSIGLVGDKGIKDIHDVVDYLVEKGLDLNNVTLKEICEIHSESPKAMEQRIRRCAIVGMKNLAALGIENSQNPTFTEYSSSLYNFREVKRHMDYIRGDYNKQGKVNIKKFINGLIFYNENR